MLQTPLPGTPLYPQMEKEGRLVDVDLADVHGQHKFSWIHPAISHESKHLLDWAFLKDYEGNGPSLYRICGTMLLGWRRYMRLATVFGPLRQFNLAHPFGLGLRSGFCF